MFEKHTTLMLLSIIILLLGIFIIFESLMGFTSSPVLIGAAFILVACWQLVRGIHSNVPHELKLGWGNWMRRTRRSQLGSMNE